MDAEIGRAWTQWWYAPLDGSRGGICARSKKDAIEQCAKRGWRIVRINGFSSCPPDDVLDRLDDNA
jgi:hypothetical protein